MKLLAGDFIETQPRNFVVVALGSSTRLYFLEHSDVPTYVVMRGWLKLDARESKITLSDAAEQERFMREVR